MAKNDEKYAYLNRLSTAQLKDLLRADMEGVTSGNDEAVFHILEVIEERENKHPSGLVPDTEEAWAEFQQYYDVPEGADMSLYPCRAEDDEAPADRPTEPASRRRRPRRKLRRLIVVAAAVILLCGMVAAQASGFNILGMFGWWTDDVFHFGPAASDSGGDDTPVSENTRLLRDALASVGIEEDLAPTWFPKGFTGEEPKIATSNLNSAINFVLSNDSGNFVSIDIVHYSSSEQLENAQFEKDAEETEIYSNGQQTFYIFSNIDTTTATWAEGLLMEQVSGNISKDEIKAIINSIGGI